MRNRSWFDPGNLVTGFTWGPAVRQSWHLKATSFWPPSLTNMMRLVLTLQTLLCLFKLPSTAHHTCVHTCIHAERTPHHTHAHTHSNTQARVHTHSHTHTHTHTHKHVHTQTQSLSEYSVICFRLNLVAHPQLLGFFLTLFEVFITWTFTPQCMHCKRANYADKSPSELFNERKRKHLKLAVTCTHALAHTHTPLHNCMCIYMIL